MWDIAEWAEPDPAKEEPGQQRSLAENQAAD